MSQRFVYSAFLLTKQKTSLINILFSNRQDQIFYTLNTQEKKKTKTVVIKKRTKISIVINMNTNNKITTIIVRRIVNDDH